MAAPLEIAGVRISSPERNLFAAAGFHKIDLLRTHGTRRPSASNGLIVIFDLDPGPDVSWRDTIDAARLVRTTLQGIKLESWVKTTGGKGLHVVIPITAENDSSDCLAFARAVAEQIAAHDPKRFTTKFAKHGRSSQILIDYLLNHRINTAVAAYSVRARASGSVSVPLAWEELTARTKPERWTMKTVPAFLKARKDPWAGYFRAKQKLPI